MWSESRLRGVGFPGIAYFSAVCALLGCSGAEVGASASPAQPSAAELLGEVFADVGETCPGFVRVESAPEGRDELFLEAVVVDVPGELAKYASLSSLPELARSSHARLVAAPHLVGAFDTKAELAMDQAPDASAPATLSRWSMLPRHVDVQLSSLDLELELSALEPNGQIARSKTLRFSVTTRDNEPGLARVAWHEKSQRSLVILFRTFRIQKEADLRAIFECKMQRREQHLRRTNAARP